MTRTSAFGSGKQVQKERRERAAVWVEFRKKNLLTQVMLADLLAISRRTVQMVETARVSPHPGVLSRFRTLQQKYDRR